MLRLAISNGAANDHRTPGNRGGIESLGTLTLTDCIISVCTTLGGDGGGLFNWGGTMSISRCTISNNFAHGSSSDGGIGGSGGGIKNSGGSVIITSSTVSGNSALMTDLIGDQQTTGVVVVVSNFGSMIIKNCTIGGNLVGAIGLVTMYGGGVWNYGDLEITRVSSCIILAQAELAHLGVEFMPLRLPQRTAVS